VRNVEGAQSIKPRAAEASRFDTEEIS